MITLMADDPDNRITKWVKFIFLLLVPGSWLLYIGYHLGYATIIEGQNRCADAIFEWQGRHRMHLAVRAIQDGRRDRERMERLMQQSGG